MQCCRTQPIRQEHHFMINFKLAAAVVFLASALSASADSLVWSFRPFFVYDPWNEPILPYVATVPAGLPVSPENIRAIVKATPLAGLKALAAKSPNARLVKRSLVTRLATDADVKKARGYLLAPSGGAAVDVFMVAAGYVDKFGLLAILQVIAKWECAASEVCPEKISGKLDVLLETGGAIHKTETFTVINGKSWLLATISYEVPLGDKIRVVPLRSRMLEVVEAQ